MTPTKEDTAATEEQTDPPTLKEDEPHPASVQALQYIQSLGFQRLLTYQDAFASLSMEGSNRLAEICSGTLTKLIDAEPVSDCYLLGLAWTMKDMEEELTEGEEQEMAE